MEPKGNVRLVRRFRECVQGKHGDCTRTKKGNVESFCSCRCHKDVDECLAGIEKLMRSPNPGR